MSFNSTGCKFDNMPFLENILSIFEKNLNMRTPLTFNEEDCQTIADIIENEVLKFKGVISLGLAFRCQGSQLLV